MLCFYLTLLFLYAIQVITYSTASLVVSAGVTLVAAVDATPAITSTTSNGTCESRTINYITHSLTPICLTQRPSPSTHANVAPVVTSEGGEATTLAARLPQPSVSSPHQPISTGTTQDLDEDLGALDDASFLSFEDWKKQTLEKAGQEKAEQDAEKRRRYDDTQETLEALGEEGDMDMDFGAFIGRRHSSTPSRAHEEASAFHETRPTGDPNTKAQKPRVRSKDAGKTWKERFNFASLDAGGQVMKANPEAKSVPALLKENRDVYMLNTCQAKNKFLIVELSESILVETVAIANFEFFSSTFRQFRISVSDRYQQKLDKWVELGVFEARNTRDIQAFLIEDPRIWARYFRVEFLSHYGNEFYCPVSLLRVHGATMIQDVLERGEEEGDDDDGDETEVGDNERLIPEAVAETVAEMAHDESKKAESLQAAQNSVDELAKTAEEILSEKAQKTAKHLLGNEPLKHMITPYQNSRIDLEELFALVFSDDICLVSDAPKVVQSSSNHTQTSRNEPNGSATRSETYSITAAIGHEAAESKSPMTSVSPEISAMPSRTEGNTTHSPSSTTSLMQDHTTPPVNKTTGTSAGHTNLHPPQPTTQESFFKLVSKRLQLLEANSTLSLKYIEEQSKILREAFTKVEKRQLTKTTSFLETLNSTVLAELLKFSQQYDQVWQSTVIELETQRDQLQRETTAVSVRLNILADELVFQKRMSIVQSVLLLLCLGLVVFSRGIAGGILDVPVIQGMIAKPRSTSGLEFESPSNSPADYRGNSFRKDQPWRDMGHRRQRSDESFGSARSPSREDSPPTPYSYSRADEDLYDHGSQNDLLGTVRQSSMIGSQKQSHQRGVVGGSSRWHENEQSPDSPQFYASSPLRERSSWLGDDNITSKMPMINVQYFDEEPYNSMEAGRRTYPDDELEHHFVGSGSHLPSPPLETEKPEFIIARKPLPPLPEDNE